MDYIVDILEKVLQQYNLSPVKKLVIIAKMQFLKWQCKNLILAELNSKCKNNLFVL